MFTLFLGLLVLLSFLFTAAKLPAAGFVCAGFPTVEHASPLENVAAKPALSGTEGRRRAIVLFAQFRGELPAQTRAPSWAEGIFDPERPGSFSHSPPVLTAAAR